MSGDMSGNLAGLLNESVYLSPRFLGETYSENESGDTPPYIPGDTPAGSNPFDEFFSRHQNTEDNVFIPPEKAAFTNSSVSRIYSALRDGTEWSYVSYQGEVLMISTGIVLYYDPERNAISGYSVRPPR